jgi:hypothetical protein
MAVHDFIGLIGVIVGGGVAIAASILPRRLEQKRAQVHARAMAFAYVSAVLRMDERRQHGELLNRPVLEALKAGASATMPQIFGAEVYPRQTEMLPALIEQLSWLEPDDAGNLVLFLNMSDGLDADAAAMSSGKMEKLTREQKILILEGDLKLRKEMVQLGRTLVARLRPKT